MENRKARELTLDETEMFIFLQQATNVDMPFLKLKQTDGGWVLKAIEKRFQSHGLKVCKKVMIFILCLGDGVVGKCARYVDDISEWADKFSRQDIDWDMLVKEIYPHGVPF